MTKYCIVFSFDKGKLRTEEFNSALEKELTIINLLGNSNFELHAEFLRQVDA